jgi:hypothetical protein
MKPQQREVTERIRGALRGQPLEDALRRVGQGAAQGIITEDDLVIAVSKLNANLYLGDLKEFVNAVKAATGSQDNRLPMAETLQLISGGGQ